MASCSLRRERPEGEIYPVSYAFPEPVRRLHAAAVTSMLVDAT